MKLEVGMQMPDFAYETPWAKKTLSESTDGRKSVVLFLRYLGCSTCQLNLRKLIRDYPKFRELGAEVLVVLQSEPETIREQAQEGFFPYDIICDPSQELYHRFEIGSNPHPEIKSEKLVARIAEARAEGITHGKFEGNEAQSPATFVLDENRMITYAWYGVESIDVPENEELLALLK